MPLLNDKLLVPLCKTLCLRQLADLQAVGLAELDDRFHYVLVLYAHLFVHRPVRLSFNCIEYALFREGKIRRGNG